MLWLYAVTPAARSCAASVSESWPSVTHTSMPSCDTPRTMSSTWLKRSVPARTPRHAAPMQNRVEPFSRARCAAASTSGFPSSRSACTPVEYRALCAQ